MQKEYKVKEIYDSDNKNIEEKLKEVFIIFLTEKLINTENTKEYNNSEKHIEKSCKNLYNRDSWKRGTYCYRKGEKMITITNPEKYVAGLYERLSNEKIEAGNGKVIINNEDERESGSISTQKLFNENFCRDNNIRIYKHYTDDGVTRSNL